MVGMAVVWFSSEPTKKAILRASPAAPSAGLAAAVFVVFGLAFTVPG